MGQEPFGDVAGSPEDGPDADPASVAREIALRQLTVRARSRAAHYNQFKTTI